jgi:acetylornithine deacetylase
MFDINKLQNDAIDLLKKLISIKSFSFEEDKTGDEIENFLISRKIKCERKANNIISYNKFFDKNKKTILLNSHHDTVEPNSAYTLDPYNPIVSKGKLFGLGSNDAGGALVSLISTFVHFYEKKNLNHNFILLASAEEERSGPNGIKSVIPTLPKIDLAIVGEPTLMDIAIAEKGLIVFDLIIEGTSSHAAHPNKNNAIYKAAKVIDIISNIKFEKKSDLLGNVKLTVTQINAGIQHNVVPSDVNLVLDVRVNDKYSNEEVFNELKKVLDCQIIPRNLELNSSSISNDHRIIQCSKKLKFKTYGSPTLSDQAKISCDSIKLGPGDSLRSHTADEFIFIDEINNGIKKYIKLLEEYTL